MIEEMNLQIRAWNDGAEYSVEIVNYSKNFKRLHSSQEGTGSTIREALTDLINKIEELERT